MQKFIAMLIIVAALFASSIVVHAGECGTVKEGNILAFQTGNDIISVTNEGKFIEVMTRNTTYRIYPCGKLEKLIWKELNPNEDRVTGIATVTGTGNVINTPYYVAY